MASVRRSLGGQALPFGVMLNGYGYTASAIYTSGGEIKSFYIRNRKNKARRRLFRKISSNINRIRTTAEVVKKSFVIYNDKKTLLKTAVGISAYLIIIILILCGTAAAEWLTDITHKEFLFIPAVTVWTIFLIWAASFTGPVKKLFMYHGAEHKAILCYEFGNEITTDNIKKQSRFHPRCGTSLLTDMLIVYYILSLFIPSGLSYIWYYAVHTTAIVIAFIASFKAISYTRNDSKLSGILSVPGKLMQRITTKEPDSIMIRCAEKALKEINDIITEPGRI